jgi:hypothetical protein
MKSWLADGAAPHLAALARDGAAGPLAARDYDPDWRRAFLPGAAAPGPRAGMLNLTRPRRPEALNGFMVCRRDPGAKADQDFTYPPELARDLGDYPPDPDWTARSGLDRLPEARRDSLYAELAALSRIRFEHARRLFAEYGVEAAAAGWRSLAMAQRLFPRGGGRVRGLLGQLDHYAGELARSLRPRFMLALGPPLGSEPGWLLIRGDETSRPEELLRLARRDMGGLLAAVLEGGA